MLILVHGGIDVLGSPETDNPYQAGWALAGSAPYKGMKFLASHRGGTRNPMVVRWPDKIAPDAEPRSQFHRYNDPVPTIYELLRITAPLVVPGVEQQPLDGVSFAYTFETQAPKDGCGPSTSGSWAIAPSITTAGWRAHSVPGRHGYRESPTGIADWTPDNGTWELYNLEEDWTQANELTEMHPEKRYLSYRWPWADTHSLDRGPD